MEQFKQELIDELEEHLWARLEKRVETSSNDPDSTFTVVKAAEYLQTTTRTIRRMLQLKEIPHFRIRSRIYFRKSDL